MAINSTQPIWLQAFDFSALQPSSGLLDMDNPFATRTEYT